MNARVFVDGDQGTTGLQVLARLSARRDIDLITLPEALRKDAAARAAAINECDVAVLCLPDEAARQAVASIRNPRVRVNCILPGPVMLPPELPEAERNAAIAATLVKREGSPQHVALAVLHFIDNDFLTGVALPVDGGRTIFAPDSND